MLAHWLMLAALLTSPITWILFVFGAVFGSFFNVCIFRIPEGTFWRHERSICRSCGAPIPFYLNVPILSWCLLRGKTRCCQSPLSVQYPVVELATAILFVLLYWKFPFVSWSDGLLTWNFQNVLRFIHGAAFSSVLLISAVIDFRHMIIPDVLSLPMIALTPAVVYFHPDLDWLSALIGVLLGGGILYAIAWLYWLVRREVGMGMGDVKLLAGIGGWLGYQAVMPTIFYASILGSATGLLIMLVSRKMTLKTAMPFGPFLALGAIIHLIIGPYLQELFLSPPR